MKKKKTLLLPEQMQKIARYEATFSEFVTLPEDYDDIEDYIQIEEEYQITLEDLLCAIRNLIKKNPTIKAFGEDWVYPLGQLEAAFGIGIACGEDDDDNDEEVTPDTIRGLPVTAEDVFARIWFELYDLWTMWDDEACISEIQEVPEYQKEIELFFAEREKPVGERTFTDWQKKGYIRSFESDDRVRNASEAELHVCRQFTEELIERDSGTALHLKGYACYGGNRLYPCAWPASRDCIARLFEKTDDPQYANTLGYIYYYGRCTDGVPEYEKAFEMFSIAAANGLYEGLYKLADMYRYGYACRKSPKTARNLYGMVYEDCRKKFLDGQDNSFADAALRMGNVFLRGIDEKVNPGVAYFYYLQADLAQRRRIEHTDFFGNTTVSINIRKALDETRELLGADFFKEYIEGESPWFVYDLLENNHRISVSAELSEEGNATITLERIPIHEWHDVTPILLTRSELDLCELTTEIQLQAINATFFFSSGAAGPEIVDWVGWDYEKKRFNLYFNNAPVGWISCDAYRFYGPKKAEPSGELGLPVERYRVCSRKRNI